MAKKSRGFSLVEVLLGLGALSALSLGIYLVLSPASAAAQAKREQDNLRDLSSAVDRSFGLLGSFEGVTSARLVEDGLVPTRMIDGSVVRTAWGTSVSVVPHSLNGSADGFSIVYPLAPADVCTRLAAAASRNTYDILIEGVSVFDQGQLDPNATAAACGQRDVATMEFVYHSGLVAGTAVAAPALVLPPSNPGIGRPASPPSGGPIGPAGPVGPANPVGPVGTAPPVSPPPSFLPPPATPPSVTTTTPPAVTLPPVSPPTTVAACVVPPNSVENQNVSCAAGNYGTIAQTRFAAWSCPEAWDAPVQGAFSGWTTTFNTCTACPGSSTQTDTRWQTANDVCPAGQTGVISWLYEQTRTRSVSYHCPAGTAALPSPMLGAWSGWSNTGATSGYVNTCATACVAPAPEWRPLPYKGSCPAGWTGTGSNWTTGERRTWSCPSPTDSPVATAWTWDGTSGVFVDNGDCQPPIPCTAPPATSSAITRAWPDENVNVGCPVGQTGDHWQRRTVTEHGTRTTSWTCPGPTSSTSDAWGGGLSYGSWATTSNSCAAVCTLPTPSTQINTESRTAQQTLACPVGQTGEIKQERQEQRTQTRSAYCPAPTGPFSWGAWSGWSAWSPIIAWATVSNTCASSATCQWRLDSSSYAPNWGALVGEFVSYNNGLGVGCSASWGAPYGGSQADFNACMNLIVAPTNSTANYHYIEFSYGGSVENRFEYIADCP